MGAGWSYDTLNRAFNLLLANRQAALLSLGAARFYRGPAGLALDVGPFTAALEFATGARATVLGKPDAAIFLAAADALGLPPGQLLMVGDDVVGDVGGAQAAGLRALLVRTGKYRPGDEDGAKGGRRPDGVLESIAALPAWWDAQAGLT
jgi:HAD superfamily hydrolase (TIGR01458 family)